MLGGAATSGRAHIGEAFIRRGCDTSKGDAGLNMDATPKFRGCRDATGDKSAARGHVRPLKHHLRRAPLAPKHAAAVDVYELLLTLNIPCINNSGVSC